VAVKEEILNYYDQLAPAYDEDRFQNSYGNYLDRQERSLLKNWLSGRSRSHALDLACGTGRLLGYAKNGVDFSKNMLAQAKEKYPEHQLIQSDISKLPFEDKSFKTVFSFHVFMHLDLNTIEKTLKEVHRILEKDGMFIFDFPNIKRRKAINYKKAGWHGNTALDLKGLLTLLGDRWSISKSSGFLLFPVHRLPKKTRKYFRQIDSLLCKSFLKHFASYYCVCLIKKTK